MGDPEGDVDVESLFQELEPENQQSAAHAAITMRPRGIPREEGAAPRAPLALRSTPVRGSVLSPLVPPIVAPAMTRAEVVMKALREEPGVIGVVARDVGGTTTVAGAVDARIEERAAYLARLATMVGEELGLETMRELHFGGATQRVAWVASSDGTTTTVLGQSQMDLPRVAGKVAR